MNRNMSWFFLRWCRIERRGNPFKLVGIVVFDWMQYRHSPRTIPCNAFRMCVMTNIEFIQKSTALSLWRWWVVIVFDRNGGGSTSSGCWCTMNVACFEFPFLLIGGLSDGQTHLTCDRVLVHCVSGSVSKCP